MVFNLLDFNGIADKEIYPKEKPIDAEALRYEGKTAYEIFHKGGAAWNKGEYLFLKQYAYYFLSAPCYDKEKMAPILDSIERVQNTVNFSYIILRLLMEHKIDLF